MVTSIEEFKTTKALKEKPLISRRRASTTGGALVSILASDAVEINDIMATLRFDLTPDDLTAIEAFIFHLNQRIEDRLSGYKREQRTGD